MEAAIENKRTEYLAPFITMVFLFLVVGFLTTANTQFQAPLQEMLLQGMKGLKNTCATLITFSWFLAYPVCGGVGARWINKTGYRGTLIRGLAVMCLGLGLTFCCSFFAVHFPEANITFGEYTVPGAFILFLAGSFVTGCSATILQVVINPYLSACTVKGTQTVQRLAIGGSANAVGTTVAPFFVTGVVFGGLALGDITVDMLMMPFLSLMVVIALIAIGLSRITLPDIGNTRNSSGETLEKSVWSFRHLTFGVVAIFFYVGAEVCIGGNINMFATGLGYSPDKVALLATLYWGGILVGRLVGSSLSKISPRIQLTFTSTCATILTVAAIAIDSPWLLAAVGLCHSIMWGCIFTLAVAGLGKYTAQASGVFMIGVVGGAILPLLQGIMADASGSWRFTWLIVVVSEVVMLLYALVGSRVRETAE